MQSFTLLLLVGSVTLAAGQLTCDEHECPEGKVCKMVRGKPYCLTQRTCDDLRCRYDQECKVIRGSPRCAKISSCSKVECDADKECKVLGGLARCIKKLTCADLTCNHGETCVEDDDGKGSCQVTRGCRDLVCPADEECRVVAGQQRCVKRQSCEDVRCGPGQQCSMFSGSARCVTASSCADTNCRYDQKCEIYHNLAHCVPLRGAGCGSKRCQPGQKCITAPDGDEPFCSSDLTCEGIVCLDGQECRVDAGKPRCVASCKSLQCPEYARCETRLDVAYCVECDLKCPRGQVCRMIEPSVISDLYVSAAKVPRCMPL